MSGKPDKARKPSRFEQVCPRRLQCLPDQPCPLALERIHAMQSQKEKKSREIDNLPGCPWYSTSAESNHCFFSQIASDSGPYTDEDIAAHLSLTQAQVAKTYETAIAKCRANRDSDDMQELKELLVEVTSRDTDNTVYLPDNFIVEASTFGQDEEASDDEVPPEVIEKRPRKRNHLYGLYSQQTLERIKREKNANGKTKKTSSKK